MIDRFWLLYRSPMEMHRALDIHPILHHPALHQSETSHNVRCPPFPFPSPLHRASSAFHS